jgi:KaiC/GvpD/RAD55 family RecA-like ATPase
LIKLAKKKAEKIEEKPKIVKKTPKKVEKDKLTKQINDQRGLIKKVLERPDHKSKITGRSFFETGIEGLDDLLVKGIPKGASVLVAGGAGSGKTIMCLQIMFNAAKRGKKCLYMSFEESEQRLKEHMENFGWEFKEFEKKGNIVIKRFNPFDISRSVDALLEKAKGELLIDVKPMVLPEGIEPDVIVVDSLTAIASAFIKRQDTYRIYIEQLFRFFEKMKSTSFLITETKQVPTVYSTTGVEEFLADGVIVLYNFRIGDIRENGIEILKMRGIKHKKRIVALQITDKVGIEIYPEQEVFALLEKKGRLKESI